MRETSPRSGASSAKRRLPRGSGWAQCRRSHGQRICARIAVHRHGAPRRADARCVAHRPTAPLGGGNCDHREADGRRARSRPSARIVHRDLKPENIFLLEGPNGWLVKLLDFGIAKYREDEGHKHITSAGSVVATPQYMSPEQMIGSDDVGPASDVWALGVVAYACVTGVMPYAGTCLTEIAVSIDRGDFRPASEFCDDITPELDMWFGRMLAPAQARRFRRMRDTIVALDDALDDRRLDRESNVGVAVAAPRLAIECEQEAPAMRCGRFPPGRATESTAVDSAFRPLGCGRTRNGARRVDPRVDGGRRGSIGVLCWGRFRTRSDSKRPIEPRRHDRGPIRPEVDARGRADHLHVGASATSGAFPAPS